MKRPLLLLVVAASGLALISGTTPTAEAATAKPSSISSISSRPGPRVGEITITWKSAGKKTHHFRIETALTNFSPKSSALPDRGRRWTMWSISAKSRSYTLTAAHLARLGVSVQSANHLYFRLTPYNRGASGWRAGGGATTKSQIPLPQKATGKGSTIRIASFNVRSAPSTKGTSRSWDKRANRVAQTILQEAPGVVALQEVSPGPYTGKSGDPRQTEDLLARLKAQGGGRYAMVRVNPYVKAGTSMGSQGSRILYDTRLYRLVSSCPEKTGSSNYNSSCSVVMPADTSGNRRPAAVARLEDKASGKIVWVASVHLDNRDGPKYEAMRVGQVNAVVRAIEPYSGKDPVFIAGDFNSWQNNQKGTNAPHDALVAKGYWDLASAATRVNMAYPTMNHFDTTLRPSGSVHGSRLDMILAKNVRGSNRFENVMLIKDAKRPSDHNMIVAETRLP